MDDFTSTPFAEVGLFLTTGSMREISTGTRTQIGLVRIGAWQIHRIPGLHYAEDVHVIRVTFDLLLEPGIGGPRWLDLGFFFDDARVNVLDAVPLRVQSAEPSARYTLTSQANLVVAPPGPPPEFEFPLGPQQPTVTVTGLNDRLFRWRYSSAGGAGLAPGGRDGWFVLLVPPGTRRLVVRPIVAYDLAAPDALGLRPETDHRECIVELPGSAIDSETEHPGGRPTRRHPSAPAKLEFVRRLSDSWAELADVLEIPTWKRAQFPRGDEARAIWDWLHARNQLPALPDALDLAGRGDLAADLRSDNSR